LEAGCLKDGKKERDMKRKDIENRNLRLAKRNEHKTLDPLRCWKSWWNRQEALERKHQVARSELKLDESKKKKHENFWNGFLTPQLTTNLKKLPTETGCITTQTQELPHEQPQTFSTPSSAKRKCQNKENNYTHTGSVGGSPFKKFRRNFNLDQAEFLFMPQLDSTKTQTQDFDGKLSPAVED
jgi:hypothetical protein